MTDRQYKIGQVFYDTLFEHARKLNLFELLSLRGAYTSSNAYASLHETLRLKFAELGADVLTKISRIV